MEADHQMIWIAKASAFQKEMVQTQKSRRWYYE